MANLANAMNWPWPTAAVRATFGVGLLVVGAAAAAAPPGSPAPVAAPAQPRPTDARPAGREWRYRVAPGDTLIVLAGRYLDDPDDWPSLQRHNRVGDPRRLVPGSTIRIPYAWLRREASVAEVVFVQGQVSLQRLGDAALQPVTTGMPVRPADTLRTGSQSSVSLRFADGSRLLVVPDSQLTMEEMLVYGRTGVTDTRLRVDRGSADTRVVPNEARSPAFEVRTPAVNLGVRGTDFRVRVEGDSGAARLEVLEGRVDAAKDAPAPGAGAGEAVAVAAGFGTVAERDRPVAPPQPLLPPPVLAPPVRPLASLVLGWAPVAGARSYRAQVFADGRRDALLLDSVFLGAQADWSAAAVDLPDGRYLMRVRAIDGDGLEGQDVTVPFTLEVRAPAPPLEWPRPGAVAVGDAVALRWKPVVGVAHYRLQVAAGGDFSAPAHEQTVNGVEARVALPPGVYAWRVAGIVGDPAAGRVGAYGEAQPFDLRPMPALPEVEPPQFSPASLLLRWKPLAAGQGAQVQLASDEAFEHLVVDQRTWGAQLQLPRPPAGTYHLRLRSIVGDGPTGDFGPAQPIRVPGLSWWERW